MSLSININPSEEDIIWGSIPNRLYSHEFEKGRFFQVVHQDETGFEIKLAPRTMLKAVYIKEHDDIEGIEIIKVISNIETQKVVLSKFNFAQLRAFLAFISEIDLKGVTEKRLKIFDDQELDIDTVKSVKTLLSKNGGAELVEALINEGIISSKDIVNTSFRKRGLQIFRDLKEIESSKTTLEKEIKKKTFELFRRDSRNIEILTFDELFDRAHFIAEGEKSLKQEKEPLKLEVDDLPF